MPKIKADNPLFLIRISLFTVELDMIFVMYIMGLQVASASPSQEGEQKTAPKAGL